MTTRIAFVTGASRGIGAATALSLADAGHAVVVGYRSDEDGAAATVQAIRSSSGVAVAVQVDVSDPLSVDEAVGHIEDELGPPAIIVANAGIARDDLIMDMTDQQWHDVLDTNLGGAFNVFRRAAPKMMRAGWGRLVAVSSTAAYWGSAGQANYAAAKAGLIGLTRAAARELAGRSITANVVCPGPVETGMVAALTEDRLREIISSVPLGRLGTPAEVAATVAFLCSDAAAYITGAVLAVDGGMAMGH